MSISIENTSPPKISIIIPAYNVREYIRDSLDSVLLQTARAYEIIIINDGSTDGTLEEIDAHPDREKFRVITTRNEGLGSARNRGLEESTGDYVYFFDSDDILEKDFLEKVSLISTKNNQPDLILFSGESFFDPGYVDSFFPNYQRTTEGFFADPNNLLKTLVSNKCFFSSACLYLSRREIWKSNGIQFKSILHEDEDIIFPLTLRSKSAYVTRDIFFRRRIRKNSIMTASISKKNIESYKIILESLLDLQDRSIQEIDTTRQIWKERISTFLDLYLTRASSIGERIDLKTAIRAATSVNQPWLYLNLAKRFFGRNSK